MPMLMTVGGPGCVWRGPETCRAPDWGGGATFFHLVLRQGSDLELDEWGVSLPKCELISHFPMEKQVLKENRKALSFR